MTKAALSTDGRYFNQASKQLDSNWALLKRGVEGFPTWQEWYWKPTIRHIGSQTELGIGLQNKPREERLLESIQLWLHLVSNVTDLMAKSDPNAKTL